MSVPEHIKPLWSFPVGTGPDDVTHNGPYESVDAVTEARARQLAEEVSPHHVGPAEQCRRVRAGELLPVFAAGNLAESVSDAIDEGGFPDGMDPWGDWPNGIEVKTLPGAQEALQVWADRYLQVELFASGPDVHRAVHRAQVAAANRHDELIEAFAAEYVRTPDEVSGYARGLEDGGSLMADAYDGMESGDPEWKA